MVATIAKHAENSFGFANRLHIQIGKDSELFYVNS